MKLLITSGGTKVPIDRARHIANMSSGTFGSKIAMESLKFGNDVVLFKRKESKSPFQIIVNLKNESERNLIHTYLELKLADWSKYGHAYSEYPYETFDDYQMGLFDLIEKTSPDVIVLAAAVSDYGVKNYVNGKIRSGEGMTIDLIPLPKVISKMKSLAPKAKLVGFKLLIDSTDDELIAASKKSIAENGCNMVVANDLRDIKNNNHRLILVTSNDVMTYDGNKNDPNYLARVVADRIKTI